MRRFGLAVALVLLGGVAAGAQKRVPLATGRVGVATRVFHPKAERNWRQAEHQELRVWVWYPAAENAVETQQVIGPADAALFEAGMAAKDAAFAPDANAGNPAGRVYPLILLSHGAGGSAEQMAWLATRLARAGFIVAAVDHPGNNADEPYTKEGFALWWERATDVSEALDGMLADREFGPRIDKTRIGAAGYSLGGFTVLQLAGAETDINSYFDLCGTEGEATIDADTTICHVRETRGMGTPEQILRAVRKTSPISLAMSSGSFADDRVDAVFAIAPALAFTFDEDSLRGIQVPVEEVVGKLDRVAIARDNADYIHAMVHGSRETVLPGVNHDTFLDTCTALGKQKMPEFCGDDASANREDVHERVADMAVRFFDKELQVGR
jgi:predicted dienelactone hydrolase